MSDTQSSPASPRTGLCLLLGALLLAPWVLRALALHDLDAIPGWGDLRGGVADAAIALVWLGFAWAFLGARPLSNALLALLLAGVAWTNYEVVHAIRAVPRLGDAHFLADETFLFGSAVAFQRPWLGAGLALVSALLAWRGALRLGRRRVLPGLLLCLGASACVVVVVSEIDTRIARWRQVNVLAENVIAWAVAPPRQAPAGKGVLSLAPTLAGELDGPARVAPAVARPNVLLVVLEGVSGVDLASLAAVHGRRPGHPLPRLDGFARENVSFSTFVHHNRRTNRGLYALLCGTLPNLEEGMAWMTALAASSSTIDCLPERLRGEGYRTAYLQAAPLAFMSKDEFLPRIGFDRVEGSERFAAADQRTVWGVDDRTFFGEATRAIESLQRTRAPWFLTLLTVGTHHPYVVPQALAGGDGGGPAQARAAFRFLDRAVGEFVERLEAAGVREDTLVLITSDEAAALWPGTDDGLASALSQNWGFLIAMTPERERFRVDAPVAQSDLALSVLDYARAPTREVFLGRSLFREPRAPRPIPFANVNTGATWLLEPSGRLIACPRFADDCEAFLVPDGRLFAERLAKAASRAGDGKRARQLAAATRPSLSEQPLALRLARAERAALHPGAWQLLHGAALSLEAGEWLEVELALVAEGSAVRVEHDLRLPRARKLVDGVVELAPGEEWRLHYTLAPEGALRRLRARTRARATGDGALHLRVQRAVVHRVGAAPAPGVHLLRQEIHPGRPIAAPVEALAPGQIAERIAPSEPGR